MCTNVVGLLFFNAKFITWPAPSGQLNQVWPLGEVWISELCSQGCERNAETDQNHVLDGLHSTQLKMSIQKGSSALIVLAVCVCVHCTTQFPAHVRKTSRTKLDAIQHLHPTLPLLSKVTFKHLIKSANYAGSMVQVGRSCPSENIVSISWSTSALGWPSCVSSLHWQSPGIFPSCETVLCNCVLRVPACVYVCVEDRCLTEENSRMQKTAEVWGSLLLWRRICVQAFLVSGVCFCCGALVLLS